MNTEIKTRIGELCRAAGITTAYQLTKRAGFSPSQSDRLFNDKVEAISLSVLKTLCDVLECTPNDITGYDVASDTVKGGSGKSTWDAVKAAKKAAERKTPKQESLPDEDFAPSKSSDNEFSHSVAAIVSGASVAGSPVGSPESEYNLTTKAAGELLGLSPRTVRENAEKGLLKGKQGKQSHWFFRRSDVETFISQRG